MNHLNQLAINEEGFVFDPTNGDSYTVNSTGLIIIKQLMLKIIPEEIAATMINEFDVAKEEAEKDVTDFVAQLRTCKLY